ncbi:hypothetical protein PAMP_008466 [Pampus punctatissimus]
MLVLLHLSSLSSELSDDYLPSMILETQAVVNMSVLGWSKSPAVQLGVDFVPKPPFATPGRLALLSGITASWHFALVNHD